MKNLSFSQKIRYLWDYYKIHALIVLFGIVFFCYFLVPLFEKPKNTLLSIAIIDSTQTAKNDTAILSDDLVDILGGDGESDTVSIDTSGGTYDDSSSSTIKLSILLSSVGENDIVICGKELYEQYNEKGAFLDLTSIVSDVDPECLVHITGNACELNSAAKWLDYGYTDYEPIYACIPVSSKHVEEAMQAINYFFSEEEG